VVLVTVAGLQAVGLILVVAMLIIPAVAARFWTERLALLVLLAGLIGGLSGYFGATISALLPRKPAGSVIVLTSGVIFVLSMFLAPARGVIASLIRRLRLRLRIALDHVLEAAVVQPTASAREPVCLGRAELTDLARLRAWPWWFRPLVLWRLRAAGAAVLTARGDVQLTERGRARGMRVDRNHQLWQQYLIDHADVAPSRVDWSVDQVEHVLSPQLIADLERAIRANAKNGRNGGAR
jgi:manganese/zinc/iron transport system permease protein